MTISPAPYHNIQAIKLLFFLPSCWGTLGGHSQLKKSGDGINNKWTKNRVSSRAHFPRKKYNNKAKKMEDQLLCHYTQQLLSIECDGQKMHSSQKIVKLVLACKL